MAAEYNRRVTAAKAHSFACVRSHAVAVANTVSFPAARSVAVTRTGTSGSSPRRSMGRSRNPVYALTGTITLYSPLLNVYSALRDDAPAVVVPKVRARCFAKNQLAHPSP